MPSGGGGCGPWRPAACRCCRPADRSPRSPRPGRLMYPAFRQAASPRRPRRFSPTLQATMSDNATPDPWDSLADALGAKPSGDPQPRPSSPPPPPRRRDQRPAAKKPAAAASGGDWDSLAADFGIAERAARESTARPAPSRSEDSPPPAREPDRVESRRPPRERRAAFDDGVAAEPREPAATDRLDDGPTDERPTTSRGGEAGEEGGEAGRRRRRRGRRGGRGRRREGDRAEASPRSRDDRSADRQPEDGGRDQERSRRPVARLPRPSEDVSEGDSWRDEIEEEFV
jgi:hypothetical protein